MKFAASFIAISVFASIAQAQIKAPMTSPPASVTQTIGVTDVTIKYHRPAIKGREVWGKLVPFDQVWRAGANDATTIQFSDDVTIEGKLVPAGTYGFFAIPGRENWTLILNKNAKQWGSYDYKESEDVLRIPVKPEAVPMTEWLTLYITPESSNSGIVSLKWEKIKVSFKVTVDLASAVRKAVAASMTTIKDDDFRGYYNAANAYFENNIELEKALEWAKKSASIKERTGNLSLAGRILTKLGRGAEGAKMLERAIKLAEEQKAAKDMIEQLNRWLAEARK